MRNKLKTLIAVAALGAATLGLYSMSSNAANNVPASPVTTETSANPAVDAHRFHHHFWMMHHHGKNPWHLGLNRDKHLTAADARIITQAALLMHGNHQLQVGTITPKTNKWGHAYYVISLMNQKNQAVNQVVLNSMNGHIYPFHAFHQPQR